MSVALFFHIGPRPPSPNKLDEDPQYSVATIILET